MPKLIGHRTTFVLALDDMIKLDALVRERLPWMNPGYARLYEVTFGGSPESLAELRAVVQEHLPDVIQHDDDNRAPVRICSRAAAEAKAKKDGQP